MEQSPRVMPHTEYEDSKHSSIFTKPQCLYSTNTQQLKCQNTLHNNSLLITQTITVNTEV